MGIGKEKYGGLCHKTPPNMAPRNYETKIFETNKKRHRKIKTGELKLEEGAIELPITVWKPDNPLKRSQNLVPNRIWSQCPIG